MQRSSFTKNGHTNEAQLNVTFNRDYCIYKCFASVSLDVPHHAGACVRHRIQRARLLRGSERVQAGGLVVHPFIIALFVFPIVTSKQGPCTLEKAAISVPFSTIYRGRAGTAPISSDSVRVCTPAGTVPVVQLLCHQQPPRCSPLYTHHPHTRLAPPPHSRQRPRCTLVVVSIDRVSSLDRLTLDRSTHTYIACVRPI